MSQTIILPREVDDNFFFTSVTVNISTKIHLTKMKKLKDKQNEKNNLIERRRKKGPSPNYNLTIISAG